MVSLPIVRRNLSLVLGEYSGQTIPDHFLSVKTAILTPKQCSVPVCTRSGSIQTIVTVRKLTNTSCCKCAVTEGFRQKFSRESSSICLHTLTVTHIHVTCLKYCRNDGVVDFSRVSGIPCEKMRRSIACPLSVFDINGVWTLRVTFCTESFRTHDRE